MAVELLTPTSNYSGNTLGGADYSYVDDPPGSPDDGATNFGTSNYSFGLAIFGHSKTIPAGATITSVTLYLRVFGYGGEEYKFAVRENGVTSESIAYANPSSWSTYSTTYTTRPSDGAAWTVADVNALLFGCSLAGYDNWSGCTQIYCYVNYTAAAPASSAAQVICMGSDL